MEYSTRSHILYLSTYPPRECGIATFTQDLVNAIDTQFSPTMMSSILAMNRQNTNIYNYSKKVKFQLNDSNIDDYITLAKEINHDEGIHMVNIQHEFGIFGGDYGSYLIAFLELIEKPVIITFHSILPTPNEQLKQVVRALCGKVEAVIVMNRLGKEILHIDYGITKKIVVIPHGIPYTPLVPSAVEKKRLGFEDRLVLSSFGMIEVMTRSLDSISPSMTYMTGASTESCCGWKGNLRF